MCILDDRNDPTRLSINVNFNCSAFTLHPYFRCFGIRLYVVTGWWLFHILGMSSSQLTNSYFSKGFFNHQPGNQLITSPHSKTLVKCIGLPQEVNSIASLVAASWVMRKAVAARHLGPTHPGKMDRLMIQKNHILVCNLYIYIYICLSWENDGITLL